RAGHRVADVYEVAGQVSKSALWFVRKDRFTDRLLDRIQRQPGRVIQGSVAQVEQWCDSYLRGTCSVRLHLVQPGISRAEITDAMSHTMAAASHYVRQMLAAELRVHCS